jgi:hypothetical protein
MMTWLSEFWFNITPGQIALGAGLFIASLAFSFGSIVLVMVKIPENYFSSHYTHDFMPGSSWAVRWGAVIAKNVFGALLIVLGIILSLPGVPGQGLITILLGLIMLDIPGKRPIEARIIKRPSVLSAINKLRSRYHKAPLVMD